jgi:tRNA pseudouridine13 synthase
LSFSLDFAYAHPPPEVVARIKSQPGDFKVIEQSIEPTSVGEHVYLRVRKTDMNTAWLAKRIAELARVSPRDVGYAGRKDRFAVTEQVFSCYLPGRQVNQWERLEDEQVKILQVDRTSRKIRKGDLYGNQFVIRLRDVKGDLSEKLEVIASQGVPNYFGEQRFGRNMNNLDQAEILMSGKRRHCQQRDLILSAARSYLFNLNLSTQISENGWNAIDADQQGVLFGLCRDPQHGEMDLPDYCAHWVSGLQRFRVRPGLRNCRLMPKKLEWDQFESDWEIRFGLQPGCYATSVLRELVKYRETSSGF